MRTIFVVFAKEFFENLRDRRTVLAALVFGPLFGPLMFGALLKFTIERNGRDFSETVTVAVVHAQTAPNLVAFLVSRGLVIENLDVDDEAARTTVRDRKARMVLSIPPEYPERLAAGAPAPLQLYIDASNNDNQRYVGRLRALLAEYTRGLASQRLILRGVDPLLLAPVALQDIDVSTPASRSVLVIGMLSFFLILALMSGGMYLAIDTTAGERERGTLEPLLTTAVARESLLYGKLLATGAYMLLSLVLTAGAFFIVLSRVGLEELGMSANLGPRTALAVVGVTAPLIPAAAALLTIVAAFTRSAREAQAWISIVQLVPTLPLVFAGMLNLAATNALMAVPSLSQHFLITRLLRAESLSLQQLAISIGATLAVGTVLVLAAGRLYRREGLLG
ncbi:MAG: ABC transporter permease [Pseudomonadota bacterium]